MTRIIFVWLPDWPIDRMRQDAMRHAQKGGSAGLELWPASRDLEPFALVEPGPRGLTVSAINRLARRAGAHIGQTLADARAGLPSLGTHPAEVSADRLALKRLALWAGRYGPRRNMHGADGLWIDVTGVAHLFGGEEPLAHDLITRLAHFGVTATLGLADTFGAAYALARHAARPSDIRPSVGVRYPASHATAPTSTLKAAIAIAPVGATADAIAALPIEGLRLEPSAVILLKRLGLRRIGDLTPLPRAALEQRFRLHQPNKGRRGSNRVSRHVEETTARGRLIAGSVLQRLDQALGRDEEPAPKLIEPTSYLARALFAEPLLSAPGIEQAVLRLAGELSCSLHAAMVGARRVRLRLYRSDGTVATLAVGTSAPCQAASHLANLFSERLAGIDVGFGIDALTLDAVRTEAMQDVQASLANTLDRAARQSPAHLIDRLTNRLGADRVLRIAANASHIPERAERRHPALGEGGAGRAKQEEWPCANGTRPPFLLVRPEPISVMAEVPEGAPLHFTWRRRLYRIRRSEGPERIAPEWWTALPARSQLPPRAPHTEAEPTMNRQETPEPSRRRGPRVRDYYALEDETGGRFWIFREGLYQPNGEDGPPAWYVHGLFY